MALLELKTYPDPVLREPCERVVEFNDELKTLALDMAETMYANDGLGLAAPQVGVSKQLIVMDVAPPDERGKSILVLVNPEILESEGTVDWDEGCLSLPDVSVEVTRKARVRVKARSLLGEEIELEADELFAVAIQHEMDHLAGKLLVDYLPPLRRRMVTRELRKLKEKSSL